MQERVEDLDANVPANQALNEGDARPMTYDEKHRLSYNINRLSGTGLGEVIKIIQEQEPERAAGNPDEFEVDFETLQPATLRKLEAYVSSRLGEDYNDDFNPEDDSFPEDESESEEAGVNIIDNGLSQVQ